MSCMARTDKKKKSHPEEYKQEEAERARLTRAKKVEISKKN